MDPLSLIAAVAQLIVLSGDIISTCYGYGCAVSNAPEELRRLVNETTTLSGSFVTLQGLINADRFSSMQNEALSVTVTECQNTLREIWDVLQSVESGKGHSTRKSALKRLLWPLKKKETDTILEKLSRHKSSLGLLLSIEASLQGQATQLVLYEVQQSLEDDRLERRSRELAERRRDIYKWLCNVDYEAMHDRASSLHSPGTGIWVVESKELRSWLTSDASGLLWIHGIPGSGKTVLTSTILNQCLLPKAPMGENKVCYYYCDFRSHESCRPESVLGAMIVQLCQSMETVPEEVDEAFSRHVGKDGKLVPAALEELDRLLREVLTLVPSAILVIDALDECYDREVITNRLTDLLEKSSEFIKILVTSRRELDIVRILRDYPSISTQGTAADGDIDQYIRETIETTPKLCRLGPSLQDHIIETLTEGAGGMFRWVKCQLDELGRLRTDAAIKAALRGLPRDLDETYERILRRIEEPDIPLARQALLWLAHSSRPLNLIELAEGSVLQPDITKLDADDKLRDPEDILEILGSLVSLDQSHVVLAHNSVRDYLLSDRAAINLPTFHLPPSTCEPELAILCLTYLLLTPFHTGPCPTYEAMLSRLTSFPLLRYIAHNWADHARPHISTHTPLFTLAHTFFTDPPTQAFHSWIQLLLMHPSHIQRTYDKYPRHPTPLYYATSFGLLPIVRSLLASGSDVNVRGGRVDGTALHAATWRVRPELVRLLLREGADVDVEDRSGETPLDMAAIVGDEALSKVYWEERRVRVGSEVKKGTIWEKEGRRGSIWMPRVIR
ncbi:hypothetical protein AJ80_02923 [Polytolypa hystricis UAMH7299]|uniref:Uncharacterized protein n=1 Tax=Polytolypa hystricis (strain UAMH7299) TaxID=1447883 RepID=A0A2B7YQ51_POLH7|nr:hypothetical protein AJ80_02923 [Polytolypa hystricis UAMH7299]